MAEKKTTKATASSTSKVAKRTRGSKSTQTKASVSNEKDLAEGTVLQVIGPIVDVQFPDNKKLPDINNALKVQRIDGSELTIEVSIDLGDSVVRTIAMDSTDGLTRGMKVLDTRLHLIVIKSFTIHRVKTNSQTIVNFLKFL